VAVGVTYEPLGPELAEPLARFFDDLCDAGDERWYHPHPLTRAEADRLCRHDGADLYAVIADGDRVVAYGMLRGWDEGFETPSLGIAVHPAERGRGVGRALIERLHEEARARGAERVRLTVEAGNDAARRLYEELGYELEEREDDVVGYLAL
jgi:ribosomal protein S18 acetylase RimI-like enzyme